MNFLRRISYPVIFKAGSSNPLRINAFTIIELILVIVVLGILIGMAVPKIKAMQQNGNVVKANKEVAAIEAALESYYTFNSNSYPVATTAITNLQQTYLINATPKMISSVIYDPFTASNTEYSYMTSSNGQYYAIWSQSLSGANHPASISNAGVISYQ